MRCTYLILLLGVLFCIANAIIEFGGKRGKSKYSGFSSSSSSSSSDSSESSEYGGGRGGGRGGHHHGGHHGGGGRSRPPPRPVSTPKPTPTCPTGWSLFNRKMGAWCVQLFPGAVGQDAAENGCKSQGATLSSIENAEERSIVANIGLNQMLPTGWKFGTIRFGLRRYAIGTPWHSTDQFTTGMDGIVWSPGEPNSGAWQGRPNNCGLLWLWVPGGKQEGARVHGTFFAMECMTSPPDRWRGFLCGKKAT